MSVNEAAGVSDTPAVASGVDPTIVANIPLFAKLAREEIVALCGLMKSKKFERDEPIVFIGDDGSEFHIVQVGRALVSQPNESGKEVALAELGPGQFFGEISLLDGGPRTATVRAVNDVILLSLERADFVEFLLKHPSAAVHILTVLGARQRDLLEKLRGIRNVNEVVVGHQSKLQRALTRVASVFASEKFLLANLIFIACWMSLHLVLAYKHRRTINLIDDPPTFFWLGFMITVEAIVISMFVLNAQRRQAERDRVRADFEYQVNVKAHINVAELHRKVDKLLERANAKADANSGDGEE